MGPIDGTLFIMKTVEYKTDFRNCQRGCRVTIQIATFRLWKQTTNKQKRKRTQLTCFQNPTLASLSLQFYTSVHLTHAQNNFFSTFLWTLFATRACEDWETNTWTTPRHLLSQSLVVFSDWNSRRSDEFIEWLILNGYQIKPPNIFIGCDPTLLFLFLLL